MFKKRILGFCFFSLLLAAVFSGFQACRLTQSEKPDQTISFNKLYDELAQYDSVQISMKDTSGHTIDNLYHGKVDTVSEIANLSAPHWDGGKVIVTILGYRGGEVVFHMDRKFDGATDTSLDTIYVILPNTSLSIDESDIQLLEGDLSPLPHVLVTPAELKDKSLTWTSSQPSIITVSGTNMKANLRGAAQLTARLNSNPSKFVTFNITVIPNPSIPDSLSINPDSLVLAAGGAPGKVFSRVVPSSSNPDVAFGLLDSSIASVTQDGVVQGLKPGGTRLWAKSVLRPSLADTIPITISNSIPVERIRFQLDSLDLFIGGASENLIVEVSPSLANPKVDFQVLNPALISLSDGKIQAVAAGVTQVVARSTENPGKSDTLKVNVFVSQAIDSVRLKPDSVKLYTGGAGAALIGKVHPVSASQSLQWRSQNVSVAIVDAEGKLSAVGPGKTLVIALSRVDSTKKDTVPVTVKTDAPQVAVGIDTVVSIGATLSFRPVVSQEYGQVVQFKWDLNGDKTWDGSSDSIKTVSYLYDKAGEYAATFYVKDSEGNETTVMKKVKAVVGPAVIILSPKDSSYTNLFAIDVSWSVNGKLQDSLLKQTLKAGANTVTRSARDEAGNAFSASVVVFVDTLAPNKPIVRGPAVSGSWTPTWTWASGGGGGNGVFKYWLDVDDPSKGKEIKDTAFTPATELPEGIHTLFVSEQDKAGNWSLAGRFAIRIDQSAPNAPIVKTIPVSPTNARQPKWSWVSSGSGGIGAYQYKLDNNNLSTGAIATTDTQYVPASLLSNGIHTLYVQEKDSAGNWSIAGFAAIVIDTVAPAAPIVTSTSTSPTNESRPTWNWTGGGGGKGFFRFKVGDTVWATGATQASQTSYQPTTGLPEGVRTLYVEEQDSAGNWSAAGSVALTLDLTAPLAPKMDSTPNSPLNSLRPTWTWNAGGGGNGTYRCKVDNSDLSTGSANLIVGSFSQPVDLPEGNHTLYVQERDVAGNWSSSSAKVVVLALRKAVGSAGFADIGYSSINSAISKTGEIYISSVDELDSNKSLVMKFNGTSWVKVGVNGLGLGVFGRCPIVVSETGIPYVVYNEPYKAGSLDNYKISVARFNGSSWLPVGNAAFSDGMATYPVIALASNGTPYVAFKDDVHDAKLSVMNLTGARWEYVGSPGISDGSLDEINITVSGSGTPYVVFLDQSGQTKNTMMRYTGSAWVKMGDGASTGGVASIAINKSGTPYFAFHSNDFGLKATVVRWTGTAFENVGNPGFSDAGVGQISLKFDSKDVPYVGFDDYYTPNTGGSSSKPTVMRLEGVKWVPVGPARISEGLGSSTSLVLDQNDVPYVTFNDEFSGRKATVMKASFDP
ncbi:MAG: ancA 3 [Fibrobacteres bacterium]|nr:ancA 3 [Fibrobacterota bacterium]